MDFLFNSIKDFIIKLQKNLDDETIAYCNEIIDASPSLIMDQYRCRNKVIKWLLVNLTSIHCLNSGHMLGDYEYQIRYTKDVDIVSQSVLKIFNIDDFRVVAV